MKDFYHAVENAFAVELVFQTLQKADIGKLDIIALTLIGPATWLILVNRLAECCDPYVIWQVRTDTETLNLGRYHSCPSKALTDYSERLLPPF